MNSHNSKKTLFLCIWAAFSAVSAMAEDQKQVWATKARAEFGAVGVQNHRIQFGKSGTNFDYLRDGAQDILYPFQRFEALFTYHNEHQIQFVYQPLELISTPVLKRDVTIDGETFAKDTPMDLRYSFPFYRVSYLSLTEHGTSSFGWGASLQIRNAAITFSSANGEKRRNNQNIGPVPTLKVFYQDQFFAGCLWSAELDTIYAPVQYLNGSDSDVVGAFTDLSFKASTQLTIAKSHAFAAARYIGGGARGTSTKNKSRSDGFSSNWIDLLSFSLGLELTL